MTVRKKRSSVRQAPPPGAREHVTSPAPETPFGGAARLRPTKQMLEGTLPVVPHPAKKIQPEPERDTPQVTYEELAAYRVAADLKLRDYRSLLGSIYEALDAATTDEARQSAIEQVKIEIESFDRVLPKIQRKPQTPNLKSSLRKTK